MPDLPRIQSVDPVVIPAAEAQAARPAATVADRYLVGLGVATNLQDPTKQRVSISLAPYDYDTKQFPAGWNDRATWSNIVIENLWVEAARNPAFAQAMGAVLMVSAGIHQERQLLAKVQAATLQIAHLGAQLARAEEAAKPAIQAQIDAATSAKAALAVSLNAVRTAMGIAVEG